MLYICSRNSTPGMSARHRLGSRHIKKAFITLCSDVQKCRSFNHVQDLATIDVLRDIDYPSCAYLVRLLRICVCAHAYLNYVARRVFIFGVGFALSFYWIGNAKASMCGTAIVGLHAFCICLCERQ